MALDSDDRNVLINIAAAFVIKGASFLVTFVAMPLYIRYFDDDSALGVWYTILSLLTWVNVFDLGLGNGLRNLLTEALARDEKVKARSYISTTYGVMGAIGLVMMAALLMVAHVVDANAILNISAEVLPDDYLARSVFVLIIGICVNFVLKTINGILYAMQRSSVNNFLSLISSVIPLVYVALAPAGGNNGESLLALSIVYALAGNLVLLVASVVVFSSRDMNSCRPSINAFSKKMVGKLMGFGLQFFFAQIFFLILMSTNEILISVLFEPANVVDYSIYYRLFTAVGAIFMLALTPLWSKITKDFSLKRYSKIIRTNHYLYVIAVAATVCEFCLIPFTEPLFTLWLGESAIEAYLEASVSFAVFGGLYVTNIVLTTVANGIGDLRSQIIVYGVFSLLKAPVCYAIASHFSWLSVVDYTSVSLAIFCVIQVIWLERKLAKLEEASSVKL